MTFSNKLITWYLQNKRDLPWRETQDPYAIWLSEIILQQTRVAQGLPYYLAFLEAYPTVTDLANAPLDDIMRLWQGLGYYSRARNLHQTAIHVAFNLKGIFPNSAQGLSKLKGIGPYTSAAIASIAFGEKIAVVDGNVFRVLARVFGIDSDISTNVTFKEFQLKAQSLICANQPAIFNQAIMEFGATVCTPKLAQCTDCIFQNQCVAYQTNQVYNLPVKLSKIKVKKRYMDFLIFIDPLKDTFIEQRLENDIWHSLYQFPVIDRFTKENINISSFISEKYSNINAKKISQLTEKPIKHLLSHQSLEVHFHLIETENTLERSQKWSTLNKFAFPIIIHNFINSTAFTAFIE